jgi:DNA-binding transcriptional MerR regulator
MIDDERYALQELADAAGVSPRTVRYYIAEGLLPPPDPAGHRTSYTRDHLTRLKLIGILKGAFLPLREIRLRLAGIRDADLDRALEEAQRAHVPAGAAIVENELIVPSPERHRPRDDRAYAPRAPQSALREREAAVEEDAVAYIDRVLGKHRPARTPPLAFRLPDERDKVWRRLAIGSDGEAELVISESLYQRRKDRIDALLVWAEKMLEQD